MKLAPEEDEPETEVIADEPDPPKPVFNPVAGTAVVTPFETSTTDSGIKSVEYNVEIAEADPDEA